MRIPASFFPTDDAIGTITDLYELTMAGGHFSLKHNPPATFEAFVRILPETRNYLLAAGLEQVVHYLLNLRFTGEQIAWLKQQRTFAHVDPAFFDFLRDFRFTGDLWAVPEGTVVFQGEPLLRVSGSLIEAQILETYLLTVTSIQTSVATKAARICHAAGGRPVIDFGARRAHGPQAGLLAARAAIIGGCQGTSNVYAGQLLDVPVVGTQAHSWIMSFEDELTSFQSYAKVYPESTICLIDTYDSIKGAENAAKLGKALKGVRLDSGNIVALSRKVRQVLDEAGLQHVKIVASGDLNEFNIAEMLQRCAPIDMFGVGTDLVTSRDAPAVSIVYKLVAVGNDSGRSQPVIKTSAGKVSLGGAKQVYRRYESNTMIGDTIALADEKLDGQPVLVPVIARGKLAGKLPSFKQICDHAREQLAALPPHVHALRGRAHYPVELSPRLQRQQNQLQEKTHHHRPQDA